MIVRKSYVSCFLSLLKGSHGSGVRTLSNIAYRSGQTWTVDAITAWQRHVLCSLPWLSSINNSTILTSFQVISDKDNLRIYVRLSISVDIKVKCNSTFTSIGKSKISAATTWHHVTTRHVPPPRVTWHRKHKLWRGAKNRQILKVCNHQSTKASLCLKDSSYAMVFIWIYLVGCGVCRMAGLRQSSVVVIIYASICPLSLQHNIGPLIQPATAQITSCSNTNNK